MCVISVCTHLNLHPQLHCFPVSFMNYIMKHLVYGGLAHNIVQMCYCFAKHLAEAIHFCSESQSGIVNMVSFNS